jgi:hypothetical protein
VNAAARRAATRIQKAADEQALVERLRQLRAEGRTREEIEEILVIGKERLARIIRQYQIPHTSVHAKPGGVRRQLRFR